jgi:alpha-galactosidase
MQRRHFIKLTGASVGGLLISQWSHAEGNSIQTINMPDNVYIQTGDQWLPAQSTDQYLWAHRDTSIQLKKINDGVSVYIQSPSLSLQSVKLSWKYAQKSTTQLLGDHWERTYGDVHWQPAESTRKIPWYCILHDDTTATCFGVKTGCNSICYWQLGDGKMHLILDTHSGGNAVRLGERSLHAATIITTKNSSRENVFSTGQRFCRLMCEKPQLPKLPVYGINDWYFSYGRNSAELILTHTAMLAALSGDADNHPFSVIDSGWASESPASPGDCCWGNDFALPNKRFGDMAKLSEQIKQLGMRPGLWIRPLCARYDDKANLLMPFIKGRDDAKHPLLDPTIEENIQHVKDYFKTYHEWGIELVKHDFTTYDIFGRWGFEMQESFTEPNWQFNDRSKTNAEIILNLYRSIREAAGSIYLIGCNTLSHLSAGLFELNRVGDDTSGKEWDRTRKMGVNTLGFRMIQHRTFYEADGDCVGLTTQVPWEKNKQWMQLLTESSTPLFISAQPEAMGEEQKKSIKACFAAAAKPQPVGEPLDWLNNPLPAKWKLNGRTVEFNWE